MTGASLRLEREYNGRAWLAWHIEALRRSKKLPRMERMIKAKRKKQPQPWQQQAQIMAAWAAKVERAIAMRSAIGT